MLVLPLRPRTDGRAAGVEPRPGSTTVGRLPRIEVPPARSFCPASPPVKVGLLPERVRPLRLLPRLEGRAEGEPVLPRGVLTRGVLGVLRGLARSCPRPLLLPRPLPPRLVFRLPVLGLEAEGEGLGRLVLRPRLLLPLWRVLPPEARGVETCLLDPREDPAVEGWLRPWLEPRELARLPAEEEREGLGVVARCRGVLRLGVLRVVGLEVERCGVARLVERLER